MNLKSTKSSGRKKIIMKVGHVTMAVDEDEKQIPAVACFTAGAGTKKDGTPWVWASAVHCCNNKIFSGPDQVQQHFPQQELLLEGSPVTAFSVIFDEEMLRNVQISTELEGE
jgi:hypothetical protein